jgi:FkbM family methyltransferase
MLTSLNRVLKAAFRAAGFEIRRLRAGAAPEIPRTSMTGALQHLSKLGFVPSTVIDVGVATKTEELYETFPNASILLVEPLAEFEPFLKNICAAYRAQYVLAAAGENPGVVTINVHADRYGSSLLKEAEGAAVDGVPRQVPMVTLDQVCSEKNLAGPYLIKADVQGAELQVVAGAKRTLLETEAVILEVTLFGTMINGPQLYDVISRMKEFGFVVYDIYGLHYRPLDNALCQVDMLFVRENGFLREIHGYATPEQRQEQLRYAEMVLGKAATKHI